MTALPQPEVICTHESDLDGFVAGLLLERLAAHLFGKPPPLMAFNTQHWRQRTLSERNAWIADFSFEKRLDRTGWVIIDHHPAEATPKNARLIHDVTKSAGLLAYELCQQHGLGNDKLAQLVNLSNVADLFLEQHPDFEMANDYASLVKIYQFWNLHALIDGQLENMLDHPLLEVMRVKRRVEDPLGYQWSKNNIVELSPRVAFVDTVVGNVNLIVHQLLEARATPHPVLLTLFRKGNGSMIVSLRSRNGEALQIAEKLHGGGHANAAGASLPRSVQNQQDALNYLKQQLNPSNSDNSFNNLGKLLDDLSKPVLSGGAAQ